MDKEKLERLEEIRSEMMDLLDEAKRIVKQADKFIYERAKAYWIGHIDVALGGGNYIDTYDHTLEKTIKELSCEVSEDEDEEEEEVEEDKDNGSKLDEAVGKESGDQQ